jgi:hemerythrin-like domain-containing protein
LSTFPWELPHTMLLNIGFLDDANRPTVPRLEGLSPAQRSAGGHLKEVHDHLRQNMQAIRTLIDRAHAGLVDRDEVARETGDLTMVSNFRRFGNLCGQHCQVVNTHHSLEDAYVFPSIAAISDGYRAVAERLQAEHVVVHELLERQIETLNAMVDEPSPDHFAEAVEIFEALERVLLSHLGYEEDQISDALGYYGLI